MRTECLVDAANVLSGGDDVADLVEALGEYLQYPGVDLRKGCGSLVGGAVDTGFNVRNRSIQVVKKRLRDCVLLEASCREIGLLAWGRWGQERVAWLKKAGVLCLLTLGWWWRKERMVWVGKDGMLAYVVDRCMLCRGSVLLC